MEAAAAARAEGTATCATTSTPFTVVTSPVDADTPAALSNGMHDVAAGGEQASDTSDTSQRPAQAARAASSSSAGSNNARKDTFDFEPGAHDAFYEAISASLKKGTHMLKVSAKKVQRRLVRIKPEAGQLLWESKHAGILNIENIRELRFGADARGFREQFKVAPDCEPRWMSIIYTSSGRFKILHLVALTTEDFKLWRDTLQTLYDQRKELMGGLNQMRKRQAVWLKQHWSNADINEDQKLDMRDVETLCRNLNISASAKAIQTNFEKADVKKRGFLDFADFQLFVKYLRRRPEVEDLMRSLSGTTESVPLEAFKSFIKTTQRSGLSDETIEAIYAKFSETKTDASSGHSTTLMTADGFTSFLVSSDNMAFSERQLRVCDDMTRPLCEYYLSSSHNTYLVGGQLHGSSTAEGYIRALQQGCRTVELDVWDGPDEPVVYHGRTLTSRLPVRDALAAIAKYAFVASPYPVILSMEVHCDYTQQEKLAEILRSTLGKALVDCPLYGESVNEHLAGVPNVEKLPSPEDLKYRILVKAKNLFVIKEAAKPGEPLVEVSEDSSNSSSDSDIKKAFNSALRMIRPNASPSLSPPNSSKQATFNFGPSGPSTGPAPSERQQPTALPAPNLERQLSTSKDTRRLSLSRLRSRSDTSTQSSVGSTGTGESRREKPPLMSIALAGLIVYTVGVKWRGLNKKEQYEPSHIVSLGERRLNKLIKDARKDLIAHCRTHLVRTYPAGTRFTSSNYLPYNYWAVGLQLVSLNWQTYDLGLELNTAFFQRNGRSGYILKPELLRSKREGDKDKVALRKVERYILHVEVLSAQQLPKPRVHDPSTETFTNADSEDEKPPSAFATVSPLVEITLHAPSPSGDPDEDNTSPPSSSSSSRNREKDKDKDRDGSTTSSTRTYKTATVHANGFNPVFTSSKFQIPFSVPPDMLDLAFLRFNVLAKIGGDEFGLGRYAVSLGVLMPGYRHVPLYDHLGQQYLFSSLFIYTQLRAVS